MTNKEAALKSLDGKWQKSDEGILFVNGKAFVIFSDDEQINLNQKGNGSTHQAQRQQNQSDSTR